LTCLQFRAAAVYLCTNQYFDYVVMVTILVNCIFLAMTKPIDEAEYIFLAIYTLEMVIKCVARGFILNNYTYLRNPWNWLDFTVIFSGYLTSFIEMGNLAGLRTFRVLRALKTVSIMPSESPPCAFDSILRASITLFRRVAHARWVEKGELGGPQIQFVFPAVEVERRRRRKVPSFLLRKAIRPDRGSTGEKKREGRKGAPLAAHF